MILFQHDYHPDLRLSIYDLLLLPVIMLFIYLYARFVQKRKIESNPFYKYFTSAITLKVLISFLFALTVLFFYPGDSMAYFRNINALNKLFFVDSGHYFDIMINGASPESWSYFNYETGWPASYMWRDANAVFVARIYSPFMFLTYNNYILSTIIAGLLGFSGIWKLYSFFCSMYPNMEKVFAFAILFFPSLTFWSSGLMKDTITMSAVGWIVYSYYNFAIRKKFKIKYVLAIIVSSVLIINVKAYIFVALLPGLFIWLFFEQLKRIKSGLIKFVVAPVLLIISGVAFFFLTGALSSSLGTYSNIESSVQKAQVIQQDLTRAEQYGENYYDIGEFDATPIGLVSKAPIAIASGIFRPFIWEASNPFILLAGIESTFLIIMLLIVIFKAGTIRKVLNDPVLIFSLIFTLLFGFGIGLASANFGALVRYKIPLIPFFVSGLLILRRKTKEL